MEAHYRGTRVTVLEVTGPTAWVQYPGSDNAVRVRIDALTPVAPTPEQQAAAEARIDWDKPVGYSHATILLNILDNSRKTRDNGNSTNER